MVFCEDGGFGSVCGGCLGVGEGTLEQLEVDGGRRRWSPPALEKERCDVKYCAAFHFKQQNQKTHPLSAPPHEIGKPKEHDADNDDASDKERLLVR